MSRIARVEAWPVNVPLEAPYEMAPGIVAGIHRTIVRVTTDDGVQGLGEAFSPNDANALGCDVGPTFVGRETDDALAARATIVVESRASALREAGDVILAIEAGAASEDELVTLAELVRGEARPDPARPRFFKSTGMSWEDAVIASALAR